MKKSFSFYLEEDIINELKKQAKQEKISLSELCRRKLTQENKPVQQSVSTEKLEKQNAEIQNVLTSMYQMLSRQTSSEVINERLQNIENTTEEMGHDFYKFLINNMYLLLNLAIPDTASYKKSMLQSSSNEKFTNLINGILEEEIIIQHDKDGNVGMFLK